MDKASDPLLIDKINAGSGVSVTSSQGFTFPSIPENVLRVVAAYSQLIWTMANLEKNITTRDVIDNAKVFFTNQELRAVDTLWMSHCAGSLREIVDDHFSANCSNFLKGIPKSEESDEAQQRYGRISMMKEWLNSIGHLGDEDRTLPRSRVSMIIAAQTILGRTDITEIDEGVFDCVCTAFIMELHGFFRQGIRAKT